MLRRITVMVLLLPAGGVGHSQSANPDVLLLTDVLTQLCAARTPRMATLPARFVAELNAGQRVALEQAKTGPDAAETRAAIAQDFASRSPQEKDASCGELLNAPAGGMYLHVYAQTVLNELLSEYPAVVDRGVIDFKGLPATEREELAKRLGSGVAEPDDIRRGHFTGALQHLGPDAKYALPEIRRIILASGKGLSTSTETVEVSPSLRSGTMSSDSATVSHDASGEVFDAAFSVLAQLQPPPVDTICLLVSDPNKRVSSRARKLLKQLTPEADCGRAK